MNIAACDSLSKDGVSADVPATLYHYTSLESAVAILESKTVRASSILYLNDAAEFEYGMEQLKQLFSGTTSTDTRRFKKAIARNEETDEDRRNTKKIDPFIISFSVYGDLLSQWRAYCKPGLGICLGFDTNQIRRAAKNNAFELRQCIYAPDEQQRLTKELFRDWLARFAATTTTTEEDDIAEDFMVAYAALAATFKHPSFAEEAELRLVAVSQDHSRTIKYRQGLSFVVPYVEFVMAPEPEHIRLRAVVVGPSPHRRLSRRSVDHMLETFKVDCRCLSDSRTPYRAW